MIDTYEETNPSGEVKDLSRVKLERKTQHRKLIIFDLDETLAHCTNKSWQLMGITEESDVALKINVKGKVQIANVNIRKSAKEVLEEAGKHFEVMIFTASVKEYADAILDHIDPENKLIHHRYYWDSCKNAEAEGNPFFIKDLWMFEENFDLKDIVIVDNAVYSFINQLENGIPIIPFRYDKEDDQLDMLMKYLPVLAQQEDVRDSLRWIFWL